MNRLRRARLALVAQDLRDQRVELALSDGKRSGDRGAHRNLDRDHDFLVLRRLNDPTESAKRDDALVAARLLDAADRLQNRDKNIAHRAFVPRARLAVRY